MWAVGDGEKIERDDLNNPLKRGNSVWDRRQVKLFGTRNEIIAFQLEIYTVRDLPAGIYRGRITATFYGPSKAFDGCESAWRTSDEWMAFIKERLPRVLMFVYLPDEPRSQQFAYIRRRAAAAEMTKRGHNR